MRESEIQKSIIDYLRASDWPVWRMPLGGVRHGDVFKKNPLSGFPDLFGIVPDGSGRMYAIEVKTSTGKLSQKQIVWRKRLTDLGVIYILARSVDDVNAGLLKFNMCI